MDVVTRASWLDIHDPSPEKWARQDNRKRLNERILNAVDAFFKSIPKDNCERILKIGDGNGRWCMTIKVTQQLRPFTLPASERKIYQFDCPEVPDKDYSFINDYGDIETGCPDSTMRFVAMRCPLPVSRFCGPTGFETKISWTFPITHAPGIIGIENQLRSFKVLDPVGARLHEKIRGRISTFSGDSLIFYAKVGMPITLLLLAGIVVCLVWNFKSNAFK